MILRKSIIVLVAAVVLLSLSCECDNEFTKEDCLEKFPLEKEDCLAQFPGELSELFGGQGPPGPIVDLEPKPGDVVTWRTKSGAAPATELEYGEPCTNFEEYPDSYLKLRKDFIGYKTLHYKFFLNATSQLPKAKVISISSKDGKIRITITRPVDDQSAGLSWVIHKKVAGTNYPIPYVLEPKAIGDGKICKEFEDMDLETLTELTQAKEGVDLNLQVRYQE